MRVTNDQLRAYCKFIDGNRDVNLELQRRVNQKLFDQFITATNEEREVIGNIMNCMSLMDAEINSVLGEAVESPNT